ncbi:stage V sporulation protein AD [Sporosarcina pasteurii]|uniref:Stage V sporulation protein AD n=1 Tax=Sporosarcina pasteurii TaxID=1474 RepID=A0A380BGK0_SPOPA|nr:stage V sporulation protein AD [Sporosarcina pasteurii]MDS9470393.1 stage V sporulation protein AD [Sporosarcina pasteurii]QBQ05905.1 stage V sporulation protein AD [Sporosarcina pasteurii]SUJ00163.1 Stage V sporulation protein AD [Sporosarcina pasteurii]
MVVKGILTFNSKPSIAATGVTVGPLERESPFSDLFDKVYDDERSNLVTNEQGHAKMIEDACMIALSKVDKVPSDADFLLIGDLVNQMTPSNFCASSLQIPYMGLFSACATSVSSLLMAALLTDTNLSTYSIAGAASQHNSIERQFRYPVEYGAQKPKTAQWTATAAGVATITKHQAGLPSITRGTMGRVIDLGVTDPLNMGAAMAPAAIDTLQRHLKGHQMKEDDYDLIMTGDLGLTGFEIYKALAERQEINVSDNFRDAGAEFYGGNSNFQSGASGAGCSSAVYFTEVFSKMMAGTYKKVLLIATGALLSPLSYQQGESIPCIAHAVELTMK